MSADRRNQVKLRCPVCFGRENDVVLFHDEAGYYCVKCSFTGTEAEVRGMYADLRKKHRNLTSRLTLEQQRTM